MCFDDSFYALVGSMRSKYVGENSTGRSKFAATPTTSLEESWTCLHCGHQNASTNEFCMGAEMGDGQCGYPRQY